MTIPFALLVIVIVIVLRKMNKELEKADKVTRMAVTQTATDHQDESHGAISHSISGKDSIPSQARGPSWQARKAAPRRAKHSNLVR